MYELLFFIRITTLFGLRNTHEDGVFTPKPVELYHFEGLGQVSANGSILTNSGYGQLNITDLFKIAAQAKLLEALYYPLMAQSIPIVPATPPPSVISLPVQTGHNWWLSKGFGPGTKLVVSGSIYNNAVRFDLDFLSGKGVAFHFNPRFQENVIVRNSLTGGWWGIEEREGQLKLSPGHDFVVEFLCQEGGIQVYINGSYFTTYAHRHDPLTITNLRLSGWAKLKQILYYPVNAAVTPTINSLQNLGK